MAWVSKAKQLTSPSAMQNVGMQWRKAHSGHAFSGVTNRTSLSGNPMELLSTG